MKTIFNFSFLILAIVGMFSCEKKQDELSAQTLNGAYRSGSVSFGLSDKNGNDLLSENTNGNYKLDDIDWVYYDNNKLKIFSNPLLDNPKNLKIFHDNDKNYIWLYLREPTEAETETYTYIRYGSTDIDTIKAVFEIKKDVGYCAILNVWYNGALIFEKDKTNEFKTIIKQPKNE